MDKDTWKDLKWNVNEIALNIFQNIESLIDQLLEDKLSHNFRFEIYVRNVSETKDSDKIFKYHNMFWNTNE